MGTSEMNRKKGFMKLQIYYWAGKTKNVNLRNEDTNTSKTKYVRFLLQSVSKRTIDEGISDFLVWNSLMREYSRTLVKRRAFTSSNDLQIRGKFKTNRSNLNYTHITCLFTIFVGICNF